MDNQQYYGYGQQYPQPRQQRQPPWMCQEPMCLPDETISEIFLDNLKTATPWIIKRVNILLLTEHARMGGTQMLHIAAHFSNLIKVSDRVTVRHSAGAALLELAPLLSVDQRNEIAVELCRGLELGQQEFTKYIPEYLGRFALWLPPEQLEEIAAAQKFIQDEVDYLLLSAAGTSGWDTVLKDVSSAAARI